MINDKTYYLDLFKVSDRLLDELTREGLRTGGDFCDLYFESTTCSNLLLRDGQVASGGFHVDYGVGIRVLKGERTGYAYSESTDKTSMLNAVRAAAAITTGTVSKTLDISNRHRFGKPNPAADRYPMIQDWRTADISTQVPFLERLEKAIREKDQRVIKVIAMMSNQVSDILMYNSLEEIKYDTRPIGSISVSVIFSQGGKNETKSVSRSFRSGFEMLDDELFNDIVMDAVHGIDERFEARRPKGGKMSVVMGAGASGILLHEAMGHAFEADFNRKGQSIFSEKMGQKVCDSSITIVDDGTIRGNRGAVNYDDEGVPGQYTAMVTDGVLTSYLHDRISADHYGVRPTGNGRRESFRYQPIPRMRATYMENGECDPESIIASVDKGIYVDEFSNGQVQIGEGDFTFFVQSGFLIEGGRLTMPVKDINIIGNGPQALADIVAVGNDLKIHNGTWTCGKEQSVPVSCGMPTVLVKELTVGGE